MSLLANQVILPVSAATGAGVHRLWLQLRDYAAQATVARPRQRPAVMEVEDDARGIVAASADDDHYYDDGTAANEAPPTNPHAVREHRDAALLRKADFIRQLQAYKKQK